MSVKFLDEVVATTKKAIAIPTCRFRLDRLLAFRTKRCTYTAQMPVTTTPEPLSTRSRSASRTTPNASKPGRT
jgi:hypothetical protein